MTDPLRSDRPSPADQPDRDRDARIEELLLIGLDHYFAGGHELAINVWTRVLFLDRGHAAARAYIERARGAISERQREGEELLHAGAAALKRGDRASARQLLTSAIERANGEEALALLHHLDRLEISGSRFGARVAPESADAQRRPDRARSVPPRDSRLLWAAAGIVAGLAMAAAGGAYVWLSSNPFDVSAAGSGIPVLPPDPLPVPAVCEMRLLRARTLVEQARLHDALAVLEAGDPDQHHTGSFNELRAAIQRRLLEQGRRRAPEIAAPGPPAAGGGLRPEGPRGALLPR